MTGEKPHYYGHRKRLRVTPAAIAAIEYNNPATNGNSRVERDAGGHVTLRKSCGCGKGEELKKV